MAGRDPGTHVFTGANLWGKAWMPGTSPGKGFVGC